MYKQEFQKLIEECAQKFSLKGKTVPSYSSFEDYNYQSSILFSINKHPEKERITQEVLDFITASGNYEKVSLTGNGYISVKVKIKSFTDGVGFSHTNAKAPKRVVIDYCGANVAKKMHIGHIRSMFIGDFISRLYTEQGHKVFRFNHIGDWGNQFGFLLEYIIVNNIKVKDNQHLTEIYKKASALNESDESFKEAATARAYALQHNDKETMKFWKMCCDISLKEMSKTFKDFNLLMTEDDAIGESYYSSMCPEIEALLVQAGVAVICEDGSVIVPDENPKKSPLVIKKSTGTYLYAMYDLAAIYFRMNQMVPDEMIYVVDKRQELHFKQVFAAAKKMGWTDGCNMLHIGFGTILGADKKPLKTRSGESLYLEDLIEQGLEQMKEHPAIAKITIEEYKKKVLEDTLYGSLKFYDLHFATHTDYTFSWDSVLNTKGNSAPYLQNAYARIDSIFFKMYGVEKPNRPILDIDMILAKNKHIDNNPDVEQIAQLMLNAQIANEITDNIEANDSQFLTNAVTELSKQFHYFYEMVNVSNLEGVVQYFALDVIEYVAKTIKRMANILGIPVYMSEKMAAQMY